MTVTRCVSILRDDRCGCKGRKRKAKALLAEQAHQEQAHRDHDPRIMMRAGRIMGGRSNPPRAAPYVGGRRAERASLDDVHLSAMHLSAMHPSCHHSNDFALVTKSAIKPGVKPAASPRQRRVAVSLATSAPNLQGGACPTPSRPNREGTQLSVHQQADPSLLGGDDKGGEPECHTSRPPN